MNIFAAIDLETTGLDPAHCEVLELAIVPLNEDFTVSSDIPEFTARIKAKHPEWIEQTAIDVNRLDPTEGKPLEEVRADLALWAEENGITGIVPLAHNLAFDLSFLKASFPAFSRIVSGAITESNKGTERISKENPNAPSLAHRTYQHKVL